MYTGKLVFSQVMDFMPLHTFRRCVARYQGDYKVKKFACLDQYLCMAFAQITYCESLRDIEICLRAQEQKLYHMGIRGKVSRSTIADANEQRHWQIYADLAYSLINTARKLYRDESFAFELDQTAYALDATTIDLCLSMFPWANFRKNKGAVKLHTLLDLRCNIPTFIHISDGKLHEVNTLDIVPFEPGAFYVMDRGYLDYSRLYNLAQASAFFLIRAKANLQCRRIYSQPVERSTGLIYDQTIMLSGFYQSKDYPEKLRRIKYHDAESDLTIVLMTNNFNLPALTVTEFYRSRWQVELFFKWIKQHLRIKSFYGTSENAVKTQIWIAISVYVIVAILKKQLRLPYSLYTILQVLSVTAFERIPLYQIFTMVNYKTENPMSANQLNLFDEIPGQ